MERKAQENGIESTTTASAELILIPLFRVFGLS